jgi:hypothetical protein
MILALDQAGASRNSQSPVRCRSGSVIAINHGTPEIRTLFHSAHFLKVNDLGLKSDHRAMDQTAPTRRRTRVGPSGASQRQGSLKINFREIFGVVRFDFCDSIARRAEISRLRHLWFYEYTLCGRGRPSHDVDPKDPSRTCWCRRGGPLSRVKADPI